MYNSKLIDLVSSLSKKQIRLFHDYVCSPYCNKRPELIDLSDYFIKIYPNFSEELLKKDVVFKAIFPDKEYDEKQLGYMMSWLLGLAEDFVAIERIKEDDAFIKINLLNAYNDFGLEKHYRNAIKDLDKIIIRDERKNSTYYYRLYLMESCNNLYFDRQKKHIYDTSLQKAVDNLDIFYLSVKLKFCCEIVNRKNWVNAKYELRFLNEILDYLSRNPHEEVPSISIYHHVLLTLTELDNEDHFVKLKQLLHEYTNWFDQHEAKDMYAYAINYCIKKINSGNQHYLRELFLIYKTVLEKEIIIDLGRLSPWSYKNIVSVGCRLGDYEWVEGFINEYRDRLAFGFRDNAFAYNMAYLHFQKGEYEDALILLQQVEFTDIYYALDSKAMLLKIYYELNYREPLLSLFDSFRIYLKRNKHISEFLRKIYMNLIRFTRDLSRVVPGDSQKLDLICGKIDSANDVADLKWLKEKIESKRVVEA